MFTAGDVRPGSEKGPEGECPDASASASSSSWRAFDVVKRFSKMEWNRESLAAVVKVIACNSDLARKSFELCGR